MNILLRLANYITRYAPSEKKLNEYLKKKKWQWDKNELFHSLGYNEDLMINMWMSTFLARSSSEHDIVNKLIKKWFPKEKIENIRASYQEAIRSWEDHASHITSEWDKLLSRGKSRQVALLTLIKKYPYFRDEISELLLEKDDSTNLRGLIKKYCQKYDPSSEDGKQKIIQSLIRRGFRYADIRELLSEGIAR